MVKHTQTIRRQTANELFECFCRFCGLALKGYLHYKTITSQNELYYVLKDIQAFVFLTIS